MAFAEKEEEKANHSYINPKQNFMKKYPRVLFEHNGIVLKQGMMLKMNTSFGSLRGVIASLDENEVILDMNPANLY
ncbi:MAG: hypothetical protein PHO02_03105 [Candidatus Nanoarchaeia archaeon]|nr:hypothetical protein [Candidatus Nanoarchaeia archaeon]